MIRRFAFSHLKSSFYFHLPFSIFQTNTPSPHIVANADPISGTVTPENAYMIDPILPYIRRFHALGFGILDINIPAHMLPDNSPSNSPEYLLKPSSGQLEATTKELLCYLWDNYLEGYASENIVLMGVGDAYLGVKMLLTSRGLFLFLSKTPLTNSNKSTDCKAKIPAILSFVSGSLRPVKSETDVLLSGWYKNNSRIYVSPDHACWFDAALSSKVAKRRFGDVRKGSVKGVGKMCEYYLVCSLSYSSSRILAGRFPIGFIFVDTAKALVLIGRSNTIYKYQSGSTSHRQR